MRGWRAKQAQCMTESRGECPGSFSQWMSIHTRALCDRPPSASAICTMAIFSAGVSTRPSRFILYMCIFHLHLSLTIVPVYCTIFRGTRGDFWGQLWDSSLKSVLKSDRANAKLLPFAVNCGRMPIVVLAIFSQREPGWACEKLDEQHEQVKEASTGCCATTFTPDSLATSPAGRRCRGSPDRDHLSCPLDHLHPGWRQSAHGSESPGQRRL
jgi:hypothetical protein